MSRGTAGPTLRRTAAILGSTAGPTLAFVLVYTAAVVLGRASRLEGSGTATFWPAAGVAFVWLGTMWRHRRRRGVALGAIAVLTVVAAALTGLPLVVGVAFAVAATVQAVVSVTLFRRWSTGDLRLTQPRDAWALAGAAVVGALVGAVLTFMPSSVVLGPAPLTALFTWVARNASTVIAAGLWLMVADRHTRRAATGARWPEVVIVNVLAAVTFLWVFDLAHLYSLSFLVVPVSVWVGSRFGLRVAAANALLVDVLQVVLTVNGAGALAQAGPGQRVIGVQLLVLLISMLTMMLALHRDERVRLVESLRRTRRDAERQAGLLRTVFETTSDGMSVYARDGRLIMANAAALSMYPKLPPGIPTERFAEFVQVLDAHGEVIPGGQMPLVRALRGERIDGCDMAFHNLLDGCTRTFNVAAHPLPDTAGPDREGHDWAGGAIVAFRDVTVNRAAAAQVAHTRDLYAGILSGATEQLIVATDLDGTIAVFNEGAERMLGYTPQDMLGQSVEHLHDPVEVRERAAELGLEPGVGVFTHDLDSTGGAATHQWTLVRVDGQPVQVALTISWLHDDQGNRTGLLGIGTDVTEQVAVQARLADSESRFRAAFDTAPVGMLLVGLGSAAGRILQVNSTMTEFTGLVAEELGILDVHAIAPAEDREEFADQLAPLLSGDVEESQFEHRYLRADGGTGWGRTTASRVSPAGAEAYLLCLVEDITARREAEDALVHQAMHDGLTGLPNRALLRDRLAHALAAGQRDGAQVGVLLLDLDGFKAVNDTAGHAAGDDLLRVVSRRLALNCRAADTVARLGGDEFAVVCPGIDADGLDGLAQRLLIAVREPVRLGAGTFGVGVSIGSALQDATAVEEGTLDRLLQNADLAMYAAKRAGKNRAYAYDARDREHLDRTERLLPQLATAVAEGEFEMFGQPIVDLTTGRTVAVETLLRWRRADGTVLTPGAFLDVLETSSLMPAVGEFVLSTSAQMAAGWEREFGENSPAVHVNVSAEQLGTLLDQVREVLAQTGLSPRLLVLELTETHTTKITDSLRGQLEELRALGVRIAIDDLGTGYSGLARLTELPVDVLKIDLQFVAGLGRDPSCDAVVRAVLGIGQALGLEVVAEGVENDLQTRILRSYGATIAQGYRFARPVPAHDLLTTLRRPALAG